VHHSTLIVHSAKNNLKTFRLIITLVSLFLEQLVWQADSRALSALQSTSQPDQILAALSKINELL